MGRHSAPDEEEQLEAAATDPLPVPSQHTSPLGPLPLAAPAAPLSSSRSDLRLLRLHPSLRARCLAALIVPFLLYTLVLVIISRTDVYLIWLWIPTVLAGALVGHLLDRAHKRHLS
jgi:hypothetical protein